MWNRATPIKRRTRTDGLELLSVWEVNAASTYRVVADKVWNAGFPAKAHVAWFTLRGRGHVSLYDGRSVELGGNSLLFTRLHDIDTYSCKGRVWRFFWVMFLVPLPVQIPVFERISLPRRNPYPRELAAMVRALQKGTDAQRSLAAATFQRLFYDWLALVEDHRRDIPHLAKIQRVIEGMHGRLDGTLSLQEMAKTSGMCEVVLRRRFKAVTGQSPKKFYLGLRLDQAEALLHLGQHDVSEVAAELGFYDPFHFSKMFTRRFGKPPSVVKGRQ